MKVLSLPTIKKSVRGIGEILVRRTEGLFFVISFMIENIVRKRFFFVWVQIYDDLTHFSFVFVKFSLSKFVFR